MRSVELALLGAASATLLFLPKVGIGIAFPFILVVTPMFSKQGKMLLWSLPVLMNMDTVITEVQSLYGVYAPMMPLIRMELFDRSKLADYLLNSTISQQVRGFMTVNGVAANMPMPLWALGGGIVILLVMFGGAIFAVYGAFAYVRFLVRLRRVFFSRFKSMIMRN